MENIGTRFVKSEDRNELKEVTLPVRNKKGGITLKKVKLSKAKLDVVKSIADAFIYNFDKFVDYKEEKDSSGIIICTGKVKIGMKGE